MTSEEQGRFCSKCSKIVIDFTKNTTQEIIDFLIGRKGEDICGKLPARLRTIQVRVSNRTRLFSAAVILVFGSLLFSSCGPSENTNEEPLGKVDIDSATRVKQQHDYDSAMHADSVMKSTSPTATQSTNIDSAKMVNMMRILDSVNAAKKK